jgi:hypothetical protein
MTTYGRSLRRRFARTCLGAVVGTAAAIGGVFAERPIVFAAEQVGAAPREVTVLGRFARGQEISSAMWWLGRAEEQAGLWGNAYQRAYSLAEIAQLLADADQIEAAEALAKRIDHGPALLGARWRIAAAYARAGKLEAAEALARTSVEPDGRPEPGAYCEFKCQIACALAGAARIDEAERTLAALRDAPAAWPGNWKPPGNLVSVRARIHASIAAASAKAGRGEAYRQHIEKCEALAKGIPGDVNKLWGAALSSMAQPSDEKDQPAVNPMNAIYKSAAVRSAVVARAEAGDYERARKTLELIPAGRYRDSIARNLVETLARGGALKEARTVADAIQTEDHRDWARVTLVAAYLRAGKSTAAKALAARIGEGDWRVLAQMHLAAAAGESGRAGDVEALLRDAAAASKLDAARREQWERQRAANPPGMIPPPAAVPRLRAKLYREAAHLLADTRSPEELTGWIKSLPGAEARYYAALGVAEHFLRAR